MPNSHVALAHWPLLGRDAELSAISQALDDPETGGVALVGPAGVGKSRLGRQVGELASLRGLETIAVRASRSAASIPFAAVAPLFSALGISPEPGSNPFIDVISAVEERTADDRRVLVVDDAQLLDGASAALLDQLVGRAGLFILLTLRVPDHEAGRDLDFLSHERVRRVDVRPLQEADVARLLQVALGGPVDRAAHRALVKASGGNPLYLRELVQGALESGALASSRGIWRLNGSLVSSKRLKDLIEQRFLVLTPEEQEVVELVALGEPLALPLLASLASLDVVDALERRNVLESATTNNGAEVRLAHPLYGEVVRVQLSPVRRARLCRALADQSEARGDLDPGDLLRVAVWRLDGGGEADPLLTLAAARAAFQGEDYELARRLASVVWRQSERVDAALLLVDSLEVAGRTAEIEEILAAAYARAANDEERAAMATRLSSSIFVWTGRTADAEAVLGKALGDVEDSACRVQLIGQRANMLLLTGDVGGAISALELLGDSTRGEAAAQSARDLGVALALAGRTERAIRETELALSTHRSLPDEEATRDGIYVVARSLAMAEAGQLKAAIELAESGYLHSVERANLDGQAWFASVLGHALVYAGRLESACHLYREASTGFQELGHPGHRWGLGGIALAAGQLGQREAAASALADLESATTTPFRMMDIHIERGRAWAAVAHGEITKARRLLSGTVARAERLGQLAGACAALHDLVRIGDDRAAEPLLEVSSRTDGALSSARAELARAVLSKDPDLAALATDEFESCGALLYAAEAAALEQRFAEHRRDHRRATAAQHRSRLLLDQCENAKTPLVARGEQIPQLSAREREVAMLAAEGIASREIAERLFVSPRTVENHLQRAYVKLGVSNRSELADRLALARAIPSA